MKKALVLAFILVILVGQSTPAQSRKRSSSKRRAAATKVDAKAGAERIATQIKTLTRFLYVLGSVTKGIETVEDGIRNRDASPQAIEQAERNKASVIASVRNVRDGLSQLEADAHLKPELKPFLPSMTGLTGIGDLAERQAEAGQLDAAGKTLLRAVNQLTDALATR